MKGEYLATDTETGGFDETKNPILTCYMAVVGEDFGIIDELDLAIKPEAPFTEVTAGALEVNNIDMAKHTERPDLVTRAQANEKIKAFLKKNKPKGAKLKPLGHNLAYDKRMIQAQLLSKEEWEDLLHYAEMDTKMAGDLLKKAGWLPPEIGKLESLVKHFSITQLGAHNARNDTLMTVEVFRRLIEMLSSRKNSGGESGLDVLSLLEK
jgi:DNA polymerase III alpha subunit (gram-positive type)